MKFIYREDHEEHPHGRPEPCGLQEVAKEDGTRESTQPTDHTHDAADHPHFIGEVVRDVAIDRGLPDSPDDSHHEHQESEDPHVGLEEHMRGT